MLHKLPWTCEHNDCTRTPTRGGRDIPLADIRDADGNIVADDVDLPDAELIVLAVNAHALQAARGTV